MLRVKLESNTTAYGAWQDTMKPGIWIPKE